MEKIKRLQPEPDAAFSLHNALFNCKTGKYRVFQFNFLKR